MSRFFELAAYANPEENNGVPGLLDCAGSYIPESEVVSAAKSLFAASPMDVDPECPFTGKVWKVGIAETNPETKGYVNEPKGFFRSGKPIIHAKHQWFASLEEVRKVFLG